MFTKNPPHAHFGAGEGWEAQLSHGNTFYEGQNPSATKQTWGDEDDGRDGMYWDENEGHKSVSLLV